MKLLQKNDYHKVINLLEKLEMNILFAQDVVYQKVDGKIYVDEIEEPQTIYIIHPYGISLLFGDCENEKFNSQFKVYSLNRNNLRTNFVWMIASKNWEEKLSELYKDCSILSKDNVNSLEKGIVEINTRVNFKFNQNKHRPLKNIEISPEIKIMRINKPILEEMKGNVIPHFFWRNHDSFLENGVGFGLFYQDKLASTSFAACIRGNYLEIGVETFGEYKGKGFAELVCLAIIDYAVENNFEPIWACRLENTGSYILAQKVGFEPILEIPFYRLSN